MMFHFFIQLVFEETARYFHFRRNRTSPLAKLEAMHNMEHTQQDKHIDSKLREQLCDYYSGQSTLELSPGISKTHIKNLTA